MGIEPGMQLHDRESDVPNQNKDVAGEVGHDRKKLERVAVVRNAYKSTEPRVAAMRDRRVLPIRALQLALDSPHIGRDDKYDLPRALSFVREAAGEAAGANPNPLGVVREEMFGPRVPSRLELKYAHLPVVPLDDSYYELWGWSVRPPAVEHTGIADGLLGGGWHLVAPSLVLGWMVALPLLYEPKGRATYLGRRHLGLKSGFQAADRARYFLKLSKESRDLATLTLRRNILGALAELEVVPPNVTDVGVPVQSLLLGVYDGEECCALISGDHLRLWYREGEAWQREPQETVPLHETKAPFFMTRLFDGSIRFEGVHVGGSKEPLVLRDLTLHTFPAKTETFPAKAWRLRTGLDPRFVIPTTFLDQAGNRLPL